MFMCVFLVCCAAWRRAAAAARRAKTKPALSAVSLRRARQTASYSSSFVNGPCTREKRVAARNENVPQKGVLGHDLGIHSRPRRPIQVQWGLRRGTPLRALEADDVAGVAEVAAV